MKNRIQLCTFLVFAFLAIGGQPLLADSSHTHIYVVVKGMACPFCVRGLEKHLKKIDGVEGVVTSLEKGEATLHVNPGHSVTEDRVRAAVKKAGFTAGKIRIEKGDGE